MASFSFILFIITSVTLIIINVKKEDGILRAPAIVSLVAFFSLSPLMIQSLINPYYKQDILPNFILFICLCLICFHFGFIKGTTADLENKEIRQIEDGKNKYVCIIFCLFGVWALMVYQGLFSGMDWVIAGFLQSFGIISIFLSFNEIKNRGLPNSTFYLIILCISFWCVIDYAFNIKGSRTRFFYIMVFCCLYLTRIIPWKSRQICKTLLCIFIVGSIASFSMVDYRTNIDKPFLERISLNQILENYRINIIGQGKISINGQDFYNGARYADYAWENYDYNYGTFIWNGLIFNYLPQRFVGQETKESLMVPLENRTVVARLTHGVTTVTGFGDAFAAFSFFGCIIFYVIAYFLGKWWISSFSSDFYLLLYAYSIMYIAPMITHGIVYFISPLVFFWVAICPILRRSFYYTEYEETNSIS